MFVYYIQKTGLAQKRWSVKRHLIQNWMLYAGNPIFLFIFKVFKKTNARPFICSFLIENRQKFAQAQIKICIFIISNLAGTLKTADKNWKWNEMGVLLSASMVVTYKNLQS